MEGIKHGEETAQGYVQTSETFNLSHKTLPYSQYERMRVNWWLNRSFFNLYILADELQITKPQWNPVYAWLIRSLTLDWKY